MELDGDFSLLSASQKLFILPKMPSGIERRISLAELYTVVARKQAFSYFHVMPQVQALGFTS